MLANDYEKSNTKKRLSEILPIERPLPADEQAEAAILGAILYEPENAAIALEKFGTENVFASPKHQKIFDCIKELIKNSTPIDPTTLASLLKDKNLLDEVGGYEYLIQLQNSIATTANFEAWCNNVRQKAIQRNIIRSLYIALEDSYNPEKKVYEVIGRLEENLLKGQLLGSKDFAQRLDEIIKSEAFPYIDKILRKEKPEAVIETHFPDLDKKLGGGMKPGEMYVIAARPGVGKTSFALNILTNVCLSAEKIPVAFFSMEMTKREIAMRLLYSEAGVSRNDILDPTLSESARKKYQIQITNAASNFRNAPFYIDPTPALHLMDLRSRAKNLIRKYNVKLIAIDYLQLMHADEDSKSETRQIEVSLISGGLKSLAKDLNLPLLVLAQLNRQAEKEGKPKLSNLRESGAIEQDADVVMFLHRDTAKQQNASREAEENGLEAELIIAKNRNGEMGTIQLLFFPRITTFRQKGRIISDDIPKK